MGKGQGKTGKKKSSYQYKKRCCSWDCKKRANYEINGKYYCKQHVNEN